MCKCYNHTGHRNSGIFVGAVNCPVCSVHVCIDYFRGTQRIVSVNCLFGRPLVTSDFPKRIANCHLGLS